MGFTVRPGTPADGGAATRVFADAFNDLSRRYGFGDGPNPSVPNPYFAYAAAEQPEGFWVAEDDGAVVGFSLSWVYETVWFLAYLFVLPDHQGGGVGQELLERAFRNGKEAPIENRALITIAYNPASIALYTKYGMYPRESIYWMTGSYQAGAEGVRPEARGGPGQALARAPVRSDHAGLAALAELDRSVLGCARDPLHRYVLSLPGSACSLYREAGNPRGAARGYAYLRRPTAEQTVRIGPLAADTAADFGTVMRDSLAVASETGGKVSLVVPGSNEEAMRLALRGGLRISYPYLLMSAKPFGDWTRYLLHSPGLL